MNLLSNRTKGKKIFLFFSKYCTIETGGDVDEKFNNFTG